MRRLADGDDARSLSNRLRSRRFERFERLAARLERPLTVLDVGGTNDFWEQRGWAGRDDVEITLLNHAAEPEVHPNIATVVGDATDLSQYEDGAFDVAFSNSVIEHLFDAERQDAMASEMRRVGRAHWVQTPNYWFPIEPHFLVPGWQWLPEDARVAIIRRHTCGWRGPCPDLDEARATVREVRLLRASELRRMFPGSELHAERIGPWVKSWTVTAGFDAPVPVAQMGVAA